MEGLKKKKGKKKKRPKLKRGFEGFGNKGIFCF